MSVYGFYIFMMKGYKKMRVLLSSITILMLFLGLSVFNANRALAQTANTTDMDTTSVDQTVADLSRLESYVHYAKAGGVKIQVLDTKSALANGFSNNVILLANEMIAYQNDFAVATSKNIHLSMAGKYLRLGVFFDAVSRNLALRENMPSGIPYPINPCGDFVHPIPYYAPPHIPYTNANPESKLISSGFHHTATYACGAFDCSTNDFTHGRSYDSCSSPRFRDQGHITAKKSYWIQYGEPNPEIYTYSWPYWNWGSYVLWWHSTH